MARFHSLLKRTPVHSAHPLPVGPLLEPLENRVLFSLNSIALENQLPGTPGAQWMVRGVDKSLQGFTTDFSVNHGQTVYFKINDAQAVPYHINIFRMGYYAGKGARAITTIPSTSTLRQIQSAPFKDRRTGLVDAGNWSISASWAIPADATSGIYLANLVRDDNGSASQIVFIVRNDASHSDVLFKTSDTTWQAYNDYGGASLYGGLGRAHARAYKVSYNRPFNNAATSPSNFIFDSEYPMVRWLEANGYDVSYISSVDADRFGSQLLQHKAVFSVGHDEYWSGGERTNFQAARAAGVSLGFFSGNEMFWKTRWEGSPITGASNQTLVCYKETHANKKIDPVQSVWTGTWRDPRFRSPGDVSGPENALTGNLFAVNGTAYNAMSVPSAYGKLRFWRNTSVATLTPGSSANFAAGILGYEWDQDTDNGFRPAGAFGLSETTLSGVKVLQDYGTHYATGSATHRLMLYRAASGAWVFGAGTWHWSWGLDSEHAARGPAADVRIRQATVNLLADMSIQPASLQPDLIAAQSSTDFTPPVSRITPTASKTAIFSGQPIVFTGSATDSDGTVAAVEVSLDNGVTWHPATGRTQWAYTAVFESAGRATLRTRAVDDNGNLETPGPGVTVVVQPGSTDPLP
jgi:hypothetical protein